MVETPRTSCVRAPTKWYGGGLTSLHNDLQSGNHFGQARSRVPRKHETKYRALLRLTISNAATSCRNVRRASPLRRRLETRTVRHDRILPRQSIEVGLSRTTPHQR